MIVTSWARRDLTIPIPWPLQAWAKLTLEFITAVCHQAALSTLMRISVKALKSMKKVSIYSYTKFWASA